MDWYQALIDLVISTAANVISAVVMVKMVSWLAKKSRAAKKSRSGPRLACNGLTKWRVGDRSVIKEDWFSCAIISLVKWILSVPEEPQEPS